MGIQTERMLAAKLSFNNVVVYEKIRACLSFLLHSHPENLQIYLLTKLSFQTLFHVILLASWEVRLKGRDARARP